MQVGSAGMEQGDSDKARALAKEGVIQHWVREQYKGPKIKE